MHKHDVMLVRLRSCMTDFSVSKKMRWSNEVAPRVYVHIYNNVHGQWYRIKLFFLGWSQMTSF